MLSEASCPELLYKRETNSSQGCSQALKVKKQRDELHSLLTGPAAGLELISHKTLSKLVSHRKKLIMQHLNCQCKATAPHRLFDEV